MPGPQLQITKQFVYTMVNNICLSTDMKILYLIDDGRAIAFPLDERKGILIGTLKGQLSVATAFELPTAPHESADLEELTSSRSGATNLVMSASSDKRQVKLSTAKTAWSAVFHPTRLTLSLVGATEVEIRSREDERPTEYKAEAVSFDLRDNVMNIRRIGDVILIRTLSRED